MVEKSKKTVLQETAKEGKVEKSTCNIFYHRKYKIEPLQEERRVAMKALF